MRVIVGGKTLTGSGVGLASLVEQEIAAGLNNALGTGTAQLTKSGLGRLVARAQTASELEARRIFTTAADIVDRSKAGPYRQSFSHASFIRNDSWDRHRMRHGFDTADLGGASRRFDGHGLQATGGVNWVDLSPGWVRFKSYNHPQNARKFFKAGGHLVGAFRSGQNQAAWVTRFGGIKIKSRHDLNKLKKYRRSTVTRAWVLGDLEINIFPNIAAALLPMLASHRWSDESQGAFEETFFRGEMQEKLVGPPGRHRPLIQPLVQFWMAFRIPAAINRSIRAEFKK